MKISLRWLLTVVLVVMTLIQVTATPSHAAVLAGPVTNPANGHSYYLLTNTTWASAESEAVTLGGHLATIRNADESAWVSSAFGRYDGVQRNLWIGLNDLAQAGTFTWVSGESSSYRNWDSGQPDTIGTERYGEILSSGKWNNSSATISDRYGVVEVIKPLAAASSLVIKGPATINPISMASYTATVTYSDGSTAVVTPSWRVTSSSFVTIDSAGILKTQGAAAEQQLTVSASFTIGNVTQTGSKTVAVTEFKNGTVYFYDDFESGLDNWTYSGMDWGLTSTDSRSGGNCITDSPQGNYPSYANSTIAMAFPVIINSAVEPVLSFWYKNFLNSDYYYGSNRYDYGYVELSQDWGATWTTIYTISYNNSTWINAKIDLSKYKNKPIQIRFRLHDDPNAGVSDGWYIDDVAIKENDTEKLAFPFFDNFENGLDNWIASGRDWAITSADSRSASHSITDSPGGSYPYYSNARIELAHPIDLSTTTAPVLSFWYKGYFNSDYYYGANRYDYGYVDVSQDGGLTWTQVVPFSGNVSTWTLVRVDLTPYRQKPVLIRFRMSDDASAGVSDGWYIDDVEIKEKDAARAPFPFFDNFENGLDNWLTSGREWGTTSADSRSASHSLTDSPNGNYPYYTTARIELAHPIDLSTTTAPVLSFWYKCYFNSDYYYGATRYDYGYVDVSQDGGLTWTQVAPFSANVSTWTLTRVDLSPYKQKPVLIRFRMGDDPNAGVSDGWYIDDVEIKEKDIAKTPFPFFDNFENGLDNWLTSGRDWGVTSAESRSSSHSLTDSPTGSYPYYTTARIELAHPMDLSSTNSPVLSFWYKGYFNSDYYYGSNRYDYGYVDVSQDGGLTWTQIASYYGNISTWTLVKLDLSPYKQASTSVRFRMADDPNAGVSDGWYIDDVKIVDTFTITTSAASNGTITPTQKVLYQENATKIFVIPNMDYHLAGVLVDGVPQSISNPKTFSISFNSVTANHTVTAIFASDSSGPVVSITSPASSAQTNNQTPKLTYSVNDSTATVVVKLDGNSITINNNDNLPTLAAGDHTVIVEATDLLGRVGSTLVTFTVDLTPPAVGNLVLPGYVTTLTVPVTSFTGTDNLSVGGYLLTETPATPALSDLKWSTAAPTSYTFASAGNKTLYAWVKDKAGNISSGKSVSVNVDTRSFDLTGANLALVQGESGQGSVTATAPDGFATAVALTWAFTAAPPTGATVSIAPPSITPSTGGASATVTLSTTAATPIGDYTIRVTASGNGTTKTFDLTAHVLAPLAITTASPLPNGAINQAYSGSIASTGGIAPVTFTVSAGTLPVGVSLGGGGALSGTPGKGGTSTFTVKAADSAGHETSRNYTLTINDPNYRALVLEAASWQVAKDASAPLRVRVVDDSGGNVALAADTQINIEASSATGRFSTDNMNFSSGSIAVLTIPAGAGNNTVDFYYRDSAAGVATLTASGKAGKASSGWVAGSNPITVTNPALVDAALTINQVAASTYGQGSIIGGSLRSGQGSPLPAKTVAIIFTSPSGATLPERNAITASDGTFSFSADLSVIDTAGNWGVQAVFKSDPDYNQAQAGTSFTVSRADSSVTFNIDAIAVSPTGKVTISGKIGAGTPVPVDLSGLPVEVRLTDPDKVVHIITTNTYDSLGHLTAAFSQFNNKTGQWSVNVHFGGGSNFNPSDAVAKDLVVAASSGYAILIEGDNSGTYRSNYTASLDKIYQQFLSRGLKPEDIQYLSFEGTGHAGVDALTTKQAIQEAITVWALSRIGQKGNAPLYIVLMDHGDKGKFYLGSEILTPGDLAGWLATLEGALKTDLGVDLQTVIVDGSCYSGSFIPGLAKQGRIIITSAASDEKSIQGPPKSGTSYGEYFVYYLFAQMTKGYSVFDAFKYAAAMTQTQQNCLGWCPTNSLFTGDNTLQHPLLNDSGTGNGSTLGALGQVDGFLSATIYLGLGSNSVGLSWKTVMPTTTVMLGSIPDLFVQTDAPADTTAVWVNVRKPSYVPPDTGGSGQIDPNLPQLTGQYNSAAQRWEFPASLNPSLGTLFNEAGTYTLSFYALDTDGNVIAPAVATLYLDTAANQPPSPFGLTAPANGDSLNTEFLLFSWEEKGDPDGDRLTYTLRLYDDNGGTKGEMAQQFELIPQGGYFLDVTKAVRPDGTALFTSGNYYWWEVSAVDGKGRTTRGTGGGRFQSTFTNALTGIVTGMVADAGGAPLPGSTVSFGAGGSATSLSNGRYFLMLAPGTGQLSAVAPGYPASGPVTVTVTSGGVVTQNFTLSATAAVSGACGSSAGKSFTAAPAANLCSQGTPQTVTYNQGTHLWEWGCAGSGGGTAAACTARVAAKPGDANGDGVVSISEVQSAINMYLGIKAADSCVDTDASGSVSISEVQKTINGFLGL